MKSPKASTSGKSGYPAAGATRSGIVTGPSFTRCTCMSAANRPGHLGMGSAGLCHQVVIKPAALIGGRRLRETGAVAARGVGRQRELADQQQAAGPALAVQVLHALVHLARVVAEDAQLEHLGQQLVGLGLGVTPLGAHQYQQARANSAYDLPVHLHARLPHALQQADHSSPVTSRALTALPLTRPWFRRCAACAPMARSTAT